MVGSWKVLKKIKKKKSVTVVSQNYYLEDNEVEKLYSYRRIVQSSLTELNLLFTARKPTTPA